MHLRAAADSLRSHPTRVKCSTGWRAQRRRARRRAKRTGHNLRRLCGIEMWPVYYHPISLWCLSHLTYVRYIPVAPSQLDSDVHYYYNPDPPRISPDHIQYIEIITITDTLSQCLVVVCTTSSTLLLLNYPHLYLTLYLSISSSPIFGLGFMWPRSRDCGVVAEVPRRRNIPSFARLAVFTHLHLFYLLP